MQVQWPARVEDAWHAMPKKPLVQGSRYSCVQLNANTAVAAELSFDILKDVVSKSSRHVVSASTDVADRHDSSGQHSRPIT